MDTGWHVSCCSDSKFFLSAFSVQLFLPTAWSYIVHGCFLAGKSNFLFLPDLTYSFRNSGPIWWNYNLHMSFPHAWFPAGQTEAACYECLRQDPAARCLSPTMHTSLGTFLHSLLSLADMGENSYAVGFTLLSVDYSSLAVYSGREWNKIKALLVPKICLPSVPSVQFDKASHRSRRK